MSKWNSLLAFFLGLALASPCTLKAAGQTVHMQFKGLAATADFDTVDPSGCIETFGSLTAIDGSIKQVGRPQVSSGMFMFISQANNCTQTQLILADGSAALAPGALQIDKSLKSAALDATLEVFDLVSNASLPVAIKLTWTGAGQLGGFEEHSNVRQPALSFRSTVRNSGTFRPATTLGSITLSRANLVSGTSTGALSSTKQGEVDISH
jgi:hypothetical protein